MKLVIQMPALNEEASIAQVLRSLPSTLPGIDEIVRLVVDDGSTDRTAELARAEGAVVVSHPRNLGVGMAFRTGIAKATELGADIVVTIDSDGQFNVNDIPVLLAPILAGEADFVTASRFLDPALVPEMPAAKRWGNDVIARWLSAITKQTYRDVSCGFRAYSRNAFLRLNLLGSASGSKGVPSRATQTMSRWACKAVSGRCPSPAVAGTSKRRSSAALRRTANPWPSAQAWRRSQRAFSCPEGCGTEQRRRKFSRKSASAAASSVRSAAFAVANVRSMANSSVVTCARQCPGGCWSRRHALRKGRWKVFSSKVSSGWRRHGLAPMRGVCTGRGESDK